MVSPAVPIRADSFHHCPQAIPAALHLAVRRHVRAVGQGDPGLDRLHARCHGLDQRQEGEVEEENAVLGVVGDVGELVGMQARVEGVQDGA